VGDLPAAVRTHAEALELARGLGDDHLTVTLLDQPALDAPLSADVPAARTGWSRRGAAPGHRRPGGRPTAPTAWPACSC
jgi:hypothetical protein